MNVMNYCDLILNVLELMNGYVLVFNIGIMLNLLQVMIFIVLVFLFLQYFFYVGNYIAVFSIIIGFY